MYFLRNISLGISRKIGLANRRCKMFSLVFNMKHVDNICLLVEKISDVLMMSDALNVQVLKAGINIDLDSRF